MNMDSNAPSLPSFSQLENVNDHNEIESHDHDHAELSFLQSSPTNYNLIPEKFVWPKEENNYLIEPIEELNEPLIDLEGFFRGDQDAILRTTELVRSACLRHGMFQVINHGVDLKLISSVHDRVKDFFKLPIDEKMKVQKLPGGLCGYSFAHAGRFSTKLPWKETFSFCYEREKLLGPRPDDAFVYFDSASGTEEFQQTRRIFQEYCAAMTKLSWSIMEILGMSLGLNPSSYFKDYFQDGSSIVRCNFYPPCQEPGLTLGTGPHCDPTALTILHQDQVGGLQIFADDKWKSVTPRHDALVINLGDTFTALSNGIYKSCSHRAVVNKWMERVSVAFFLCPRDDKTILPPQDLIDARSERVYPDFTWSDLLEFTQKHYRVDVSTLHNFTQWLISNDIKAHSTQPI